LKVLPTDKRECLCGLTQNKGKTQVHCRLRSSGARKKATFEEAFCPRQRGKWLKGKIPLGRRDLGEFSTYSGTEIEVSRLKSHERVRVSSLSQRGKWGGKEEALQMSIAVSVREGKESGLMVHRGSGGGGELNVSAVKVGGREKVGVRPDDGSRQS